VYDTTISLWNVAEYIEGLYSKVDVTIDKIVMLYLKVADWVVICKHVCVIVCI
jgi:hypothetical protein